MYSNEKKSGFSILDLLVKIIFAAIFIFILVWLFQKKIPKVNMEPFYSNIFRENIKYMQEAGESFFTTDKLPIEVGESDKLTLAEMEDMNLIIPFVDQDGKACNKNDSYVSITKLEDDLGYELKTNLVCEKESNFITKILGCHEYCPNNGVTCNCNCNGGGNNNNGSSCSYSKVTQYQFKKLVSGTSTKYSCQKGYTLKGKYCYKTTLVDSKSALVTKTRRKKITKDAELVTTDAQLKPLKVNVSTTTDIKNATRVTNLVDTKNATKVTNLVDTKNAAKVTSVVDTKNAAKVTSLVDTKDATAVTSTYSCQKRKTERQCHTVYEQHPYNCNCRTTIINGKPTTTCNTCYESVPVQHCEDVIVYYTGTCTKVTYNCNKYPEYTLEGKKCKKYEITYNCNAYSGYTLDGTKCKKYETTYNCNAYSGYTLDGTKCKKYETTYNCNAYSGYTLDGTKCKKYETTYNCNAYPGYTLDGTKCKKTIKTYSCPTGTDVYEGTGANLKCYKLIAGSTYYRCKDSSYTLSGRICYKYITETYTVKECPSNYELEGNKCNLYKTDKVKAKVTTTSSSSYKYKWSTSRTLSGWTFTGKTRTVRGEKVCK